MQINDLIRKCDEENRRSSEKIRRVSQSVYMVPYRFSHQLPSCYLWPNHTSKFHPNFWTVVAVRSFSVRYAMYFRFCRWRHVSSSSRDGGARGEVRRLRASYSLPDKPKQRTTCWKRWHCKTADWRTRQWRTGVYFWMFLNEVDYLLKIYYIITLPLYV